MEAISVHEESDWGKYKGHSLRSRQLFISYRPTMDKYFKCSDIVILIYQTISLGSYRQSQTSIFILLHLRHCNCTYYGVKHVGKIGYYTGEIAWDWIIFTKTSSCYNYPCIAFIAGPYEC